MFKVIIGLKFIFSAMLASGFLPVLLVIAAVLLLLAFVIGRPL